MNFNSCFDIIGPIMVGPSSSHTAGVVSIGKFIYDVLEGAPNSSKITFYDSFAETHKGHGTDKAIIGGLLGMETDDIRIRDSFKIAEELKFKYEFLIGEECPYFDHPNTLLIETIKNGSINIFGGASLGGGLSTIFHINGENVDIPFNREYDLKEIKILIK